jgi:ABC-type branched-subunit amino acid transport system substrate-binding protein/outer membrane protein assembly factor BamD (BamD/ComL family)
LFRFKGIFDKCGLKWFEGTMIAEQSCRHHPNREHRFRYAGLLTLALLGLLAVTILCGGCAQRGIPPALQPTTDVVLFSSAERLFEKKSYREALAAYQAYLNQYPRKPMADAALLKMGMIFSGDGNFQEERRVLQRLISDYPNSPFVQDARISILFSFFREGDYRAAIEQGNVLLKDTFLSRIQVVRIYALQGDCYALLGSAGEAVKAYAQAYERAEVSEQPSIRKRYQAAISKLEPSDIEAFVASPPVGGFGGALLYRIGSALAEAERDADAIAILSRMVQLFPDHEKTPEAGKLLDTLSRKAVRERYVIGCLLPLTGAYKSYGAQALKGIELALSQASEKQDNVPFQIIFKDTLSDPNRAAKIVKEMCEAKVAAIIGPIVTAEPAAQAAQKCGIPVITLTGKEGVPDIGNYVFRNFLTPQMLMTSLVPYVTHDLGLKRFAILYPDEKYGTTLMNLFWDKVLENGGTVTGVEAYKPDAMDFSIPIEKLVGLHYELPRDTTASADFSGRGGPEDVKDPGQGQPALKEETGGDSKAGKKLSGKVDFDAVFIPDVPGKVGLILQQLAYYDVDKVVLLGTNLWHSRELIQTAGESLEHAIVPDGFFAESQSPQVKAFVEAFQAAYNTTPGFIEAIFYDSAMMLFNLVSQSDILSRSALREGIAAIKDYPGVTGRTSVLPNGDVDKNLFLLEIIDGRFQALQPGD